jgi:putative restriction endonuclease
MAQSRKARIDRLVRGLEEGGATVDPGYRPQLQPMPITIDAERCRIFSWGITPGGRGRPKDEYRVQATRPDNMPFRDPGWRTLLLGWRQDLDVFAAWDVRMHPNPGSSTSLQVPLSVLRRAAAEGFVAYPRLVSGETEVVVAFKPEAAATYLEMAKLLPAAGASKKDIEASAKAASGEPVPVAELPKGRERRRQIREIEEKVRDQRFRTRVVEAYHGRCAFCGLGGSLTEAAHIEGVGEGGPDLVVNGVGACPNHHAAFDRGLITVGAGYAIEVNRQRLRDLGWSASDARILADGLLRTVALPAAAANRPDQTRFAAHRGRWR